MNKAMTKMMLALAVCGMMVTGAVAAPKHGSKKGGRAEVTMRTKAPEKKVVTTTRTKTVTVKESPRRETKHTIAKRAPEPKHEVVYVRDKTPPRHEPPRSHHEMRCDDSLDADDWCGIAVLGAIVGGLIGAAL